MLMLIVLFTFVSIALLTTALLYPYLSRRDAVKERVEKLISSEEERPELVPTRRKWQVFLSDLGGKLKVKPTELRSYREMTVSAGFRTETVYIFLGSKLLLATAFPVAFLILLALPQRSSTGATLAWMVSLAIAGFLLPTAWLSQRAKARKNEIFYSLPDVIDLLTVCVEAGLSLNAALIKTVENFQQDKNPLIQEITHMTLEMRAGKARAEALRGLAERTMLEDIKAFVTMLVQTEKFGTSLGKTLRTYSDSLRMKRKQLAEERAAKTAVKMLFPLTFCVFPALLVVMLAPAFHNIYAMFK